MNEPEVDYSYNRDKANNVTIYHSFIKLSLLNDHTHIQYSKESSYNSKPLPTPTQPFLKQETYLRNCKIMLFQKMVLAGSKTLLSFSKEPLFQTFWSIFGKVKLKDISIKIHLHKKQPPSSLCPISHSVWTVLNFALFIWGCETFEKEENEK